MCFFDVEISLFFKKMNDQQEISNYSMEELLELRTQLSGSVEESFNEFCGQLQSMLFFYLEFLTYRF